MVVGNIYQPWRWRIAPSRAGGGCGDDERLWRKARFTGCHFGEPSGCGCRDGTWLRAIPVSPGRLFAWENRRDFYHAAGEKPDWNGITQQNRNGLLWVEDHIDMGLKPDTSGAGFCVLSHRRGGRVDIAVVGAKVRRS
ncbi:hypothetical protein KCP70_01425 [Salmonella enterica subsp. enterica]|nr:hypothetical protein KCP70_01425 [Salmonella enterica subsp. enterica]